MERKVATTSEMADQQPEQVTRRAHYSTSWGDGVAQPASPQLEPSRSAFRLSVNQWTVLTCLGVTLFIGLALASGVVVGHVLRGPLVVRVAKTVSAGPARVGGAEPLAAGASTRVEPRPSSDARDTGATLLFDNGLAAGDVAPDFQLDALGGGTVSLDGLRDHTVVLNFWATWCTWCKYEMPALEAVYKKYRDQDLVVIGIDVEEPAPLVEAYAQRYGLTFPVILDVKGTTAEAYQVRGLPMTYFVDEDGVIGRVKRGAMREDELESYVRSALHIQ